SLYKQDEFIVRQFGKDDWQIYKAIRLEALQKEAALFTSTYQRESVYEDEWWQFSMQNERIALFGLFYHDEVVGLTGILMDESDDSKATLIASYIRKEYRSKGLSELFYKARLDWAKKKGCKQVAVSHRDTNIISRAANQRFGFKFSHSEAITWPDGTTGEKVNYVLDL